MDEYSTAHIPTDIPPGTALPIWRPSARGQNGSIITSPDWIGLYTHWHGGRTVPCRRQRCKPCEEKLGRRWGGFIGLWNPRSGSQVLWHFPPGVVPTLTAALKQRGTVRGLEAVILRTNARPNGPVLLRLLGNDQQGMVIPDAPMIWHCLCRIWQLESPMEDMTGAVPQSVPFSAGA